MSKFSIWLEAQLKDRKLSQSDLAKATGLSRQAINYYLSEKSKRPDDAALKEIARVFKISVDAIYRGAGILPPEPGVDEWAEQMDHKIRLVPPPLRGILDGIVDKMIEGEENNGQAKSKPVKRGVK